MPCMCGDLCCGSCGPAQGNYKCYQCGEWESDHAEHEAEVFTQQAEEVLAFVKNIAAGVTPLDYVVLREKGREFLRELREALTEDGCKHDDVKCQEAARAAAEAEALHEQETERLLKEYEATHGHSILRVEREQEDY